MHVSEERDLTFFFFLFFFLQVVWDLKGGGRGKEWIYFPCGLRWEMNVLVVSAVLIHTEYEVNTSLTSYSVLGCTYIPSTSAIPPSLRLQHHHYSVRYSVRYPVQTILTNDPYKHPPSLFAQVFFWLLFCSRVP